MTEPYANLPHPDHSQEYYSGVIFKRLIAWVIDAMIITLLSFVLVIFTAFTAIFFLGFATLALSLIYRWATISAWSATPGMLIMSVELRNQIGGRLDGTNAFWHAALFLFFKGMIIPQLVSIAMMLFDARGQGLHDALCGVVAINRAPEGRLARA